MPLSDLPTPAVPAPAEGTKDHDDESLSSSSREEAEHERDEDEDESDDPPDLAGQVTMMAKQLAALTVLVGTSKPSKRSRAKDTKLGPPLTPSKALAAIQSLPTVSVSGHTDTTATTFKDLLRAGAAGLGGPKRPDMSDALSDTSSVSSSRSSRGARRRGKDKDDAVSDQPLAPIIWARVRKHHRSCLEYVMSLHWQNPRSMHEARRASQAVDAFVAAGVPLNLEGMEILLRTVAGLQMADEHKEPAFLEEMEWEPPQAIVPRNVLRTVIKDVERSKKYRKPSQQQPAPDKGAGGR
jgi:hypothetical protein